MFSFRPALDASHETPRVQRGRRVELLLDRAHERERVAWLAPSVERRHVCGAMSDYQGAARALNLVSKRFEYGSNLCVLAL